MVHKKSSLIRVFMFVQIDEVISQAQTTRAVLGSQRALFGDVQGKVKNLSDKFPVIRGLLGTILFHTISGSFSFSDPAYYSFVFHSSQVQLKGGDQETQLFCLQSLQLVPCFLLSTGFQNRYINDILIHKIINDGASLLSREFCLCNFLEPIEFSVSIVSGTFSGAIPINYCMASIYIYHLNFVLRG